MTNLGKQTVAATAPSAAMEAVNHSKNRAIQRTFLFFLVFYFSISALFAQNSGQTIVLRQKPVWVENDTSFLVTLLINKGAAQKFAKIEETVPAGYTAANLDNKGGIFSFRNQVVSIIWMDLPLEPHFTVAYRLIPIDTTAVAPLGNISGLFTFMTNDRSFETKIIERDEVLTGLSSEQVDDLLRKISTLRNEEDK